MNIVLFSGGRGTNTILKSLLRYNDFHVTICLNAYDDGLSTGALRKFIPNFLGPSDIRKNASVFLSSKNNTSTNILVSLLEYRFSSDNDENLLVQSLIDFCEKGKLNDPKIDELLVNIVYSNLIFFQRYIKLFISFYQDNLNQNTWFSLKDMSFGNLVLAGIFLDTNNFNKTIDLFTSSLDIPNSILNITKGENLILSAITEDGQILKTEADIVSPHGTSQIDDIYLLKTEKNKCDNLTQAYLINHQTFPEINDEAENKILNADLIIYGPGTQSASLFPSYLTRGCAEAISKNRNALKIYVSNLKGDNDYPNNNPVFLFSKFLFYMNRKGSVNFPTSDLITDCLINSKNDNSINTSLYNKIYSTFKVDSITIKNFENSSDRHSGIFITQEIISIISKHFKLDLYKISIPIQKIGIILLSTTNKFTGDDILNFKKKISTASQNNIEFDFILITNHNLNSNYDYFDHVINTNLYLDSVAAVSEVLKHTDADNFILFPYDGSYSHNDLYRFVVNMCLIENSFFIASRAYSTRTLDDRLSSIYRSSLSRKYLSKLGGRVINLTYLLLYRIIISDPFSRFITFNRKSLTNLPKNNGQFSIYHNIILESKRQKLFLIEVPIFYDEKNVEKKNLVKISYGFMLLCKLIFRIK